MTTRIAGVVALGALVAGLLSGAAGASLGDSVEMVVTAAVVAAGAGIAGALVLWRVRDRSLLVQVVVVALVGIAACAAGVTVAANQMFVSSHDLGALYVVVAAAGTVGVVTALWLGARVGAASSEVAALADEMATGRAVRSARPPATGELADLARRLEVTSTRLEEARVRERNIEASRRELVAWVSHDLRTPLAGIRAMVEALEDGVVDDTETVARYHCTMREEVDRLTRLVDDLFELSRIQSGTLVLTTSPTPLYEVVAAAIDGVQPVAGSREVRLEPLVDRDTTPVIELAPAEVSRAVRNVLDNAVRHTPPDGVVRVEGGRDGDHAWVAVADGCGGIPDGDLDRVFDLAFRGDHARSDRDGAGLGLAIARGLVEAHQGQIEVCNDGPGCRFTIRLPLNGQQVG